MFISSSTEECYIILWSQTNNPAFLQHLSTLAFTVQSVNVMAVLHANEKC